MDFRYLAKDLDELSALGIPYLGVKVQKGHKELFSGTRGTEGAGKRFFIYSCSKVMTVSAALRLVEQGMIDMDAPVADYLPAFAKAYILKGGKPCPPDTVMTVRHLFTMSAGLNYQLWLEPIRKAASQPGADTVSIVNSFVESPLDFSPGERLQSRLCHDVLGAVIQAVTGQRFDRYMEENVFSPLGMTHTSFAFAPDELAPKYTFENGAFRPDCLTNGYVLAPGYFSGGAGVVSTLEDMSLFADCLACGGEGAGGYRLLKPETVELMRTEQVSKVYRDKSFSCAAGEEFTYALGVHVLKYPLPTTRAPLGVFGWDGAAGAYLMSDPENKVSIAFITHVHGWTGIRPCFHRPLRNAVYASLEA